VYHIRFGKNRASTRDMSRISTLQSERAERFYFNPDALGLLIEERPCSRRTYFVHPKNRNPGYF